jgi:hypothetical protein
MCRLFICTIYAVVYYELLHRHSPCETEENRGDPPVRTLAHCCRVSSNVLSVDDVPWESRPAHSFLKSLKYFLEHTVFISVSFSGSQVPEDEVV